MQFFVENKDGHLHLPYPFENMKASPISMAEAEKIIRSPKDFGHKIIFTGCEMIAPYRLSISWNFIRFHDGYFRINLFSFRFGGDKITEGYATLKELIQARWRDLIPVALTEHDCIALGEVQGEYPTMHGVLTN